MRTRNRKPGFTLVELMIVAAIVAILAAIIIPLLTENRISAVAAEGQNVCGALLTGAKTQFARTGSWPATVNSLDDDDLKADVLNTKYWLVTSGTLIGTKANQSMSLGVNTNDYDYVGSITLNDGSWSGTLDFSEISP